jgi:hypothetical protein
LIEHIDLDQLHDQGLLLPIINKTGFIVVNMGMPISAPDKSEIIFVQKYP